MYSRIAATGSALPKTRISNAELATRLASIGVETNDEWIRTRTGIEARRFADPTLGETTTELAAAAAKEAMERARFEPDSIDLIVVATTTPDMVFPSTAAHVQSMLG